MAEKLLRPREAAKIVNCSGSMIYKLVDAGVLPAVKIPAVNGKGTQKQKHMIRIKPKDLELFINSHHTGS
jgi:excisionase family DNA binding protein